MNSAAANTILYVVTSRWEGADARAAAAASLGNAFAGCHFVHPTRQSDSTNLWAIRPWRNPLRILEILKLVSISRWLARWLFFPSPEVLFTRRLRKKLRRSACRDLDSGYEVTILLTAPPHGVVLLAEDIKTHAPAARVVIDWQDLWSYDDSYFLRVPRLYRKRILEIEQRAMQVVDLNITTNENAQELVQKRHHLATRKVTSIYHHFNLIELPEQRPNSLREVCRVGFLGNLFKPPKVRGDKVLRLFDQLADTHNVTLELIGDTTGQAPDEIKKLRNPCVQYHHPLPIEEAVRVLATMDLLLLTLEDLPNCKIIMHGKLPAYLSAGPPIVALVPEDSFVATLIRRTGAGFVLSDPENWQTNLDSIIGQLKAGTLKSRRKSVEIKKLDWQTTKNSWLQALVKDTIEENI